MTAPAQQDIFPRDRQPTVRILAMPAYTNPNGNIFGGWIMAQMDVAGSVVAVEYAGGRVTTVAVTSMEFHKPVFVGDLVSCFARIQKVGSTSITVKVEVFVQRARDGQFLHHHASRCRPGKACRNRPPTLPNNTDSA